MVRTCAVRRSGFTLLELMLALFLTSLCLSGIYGVLRMHRIEREWVEDWMDQDREERLLRALLRDDLSAVVPAGLQPGGFEARPPRPGGTSATWLSFYAANNDPNRVDTPVVRITYWLAPEANEPQGALTWYRAVEPVGTFSEDAGPRPGGEPLARGLATVRLQFSDGAQWFGDWSLTDQQHYPKQVRVQMVWQTATPATTHQWFVLPVHGPNYEGARS